MTTRLFPKPQLWLSVAVSFSMTVVACTGTISISNGTAGSGATAGNNVGGGGAGVTPTSPSGGASASQWAPARVRRLSAQELRNSVSDVFSTPAFADVKLPVEVEAGQFENHFQSLTVTQDFADGLQNLAEAAGAFVASQAEKISPCDVAALGETTCANQFIDRFGPRAYRRPLREDERTRLQTVFSKTRAAEDYPTSIATVVEAMIQSPFFVFRTELGQTQGPKTPLTSHELASALSYFILNTAPDPQLLDLAMQGKLSDTNVLRAQTQRLLADPRAAQTARDALLRWLELTAMSNVRKADPAFTRELAASMLAETKRFIDKAWESPQGYQMLLTSPASFVDKRLAAVYGATSTSDELEPVTLDASQRAGFLTQGSFIAAHSPGQNRSPIGLGYFVRTKLLCQSLPAPPPGVPPAPTDVTLDVRTRYQIHEKDPSCSGCHSKLDAIGFGFSQYDVLGRFVPIDQGVMQDGAGILEDTDIDGPFMGPVALANKLAKSEQVRQCFAGMALTLALGRPALGDEALTTDKDAAKWLVTSGLQAGDIKALFAAVVTSDAFIYRNTLAIPGEPQ